MPRKRKTAASTTARAGGERVVPMGGMEKTKWSGVDMWRCPRCRGTTFKEAEAKVHVCKQPKFATEED